MPSDVLVPLFLREALFRSLALCLPLYLSSMHLRPPLPQLPCSTFVCGCQFSCTPFPEWRPRSWCLVLKPVCPHSWPCFWGCARLPQLLPSPWLLPLLLEPHSAPLLSPAGLLFLHDKVLRPLHCDIIRSQSLCSSSFLMIDGRVLNLDLRKSALASRILRALDRELGGAFSSRRSF